jgi:hypothetical protein
MNKSLKQAARLLPLLFLAGCAAQRQPPADPARQAFVVRGEGTTRIARVITTEAACPSIDIDGNVEPMALRVPAGTVPERTSDQADRKAAAFPVTTCEVTLPDGVRKARIGSRELALGALEPTRIVVIGDTGCRMKGSENAFQSCDDEAAWPLARVARSAAALHPDLVIHVGDLHYRESPCPPGQVACQGSPWGFGADVWMADLFTPARPLLEAAPWVFVRGNHETCARAGQGWFRFLDSRPWTPARSCDDPYNDQDADYSMPYPVALGGGTQLIVFDSAHASGKPYAPDDAAFAHYQQQFREVDRIAGQAQQSFFASHHPVLGLGLAKPGHPIKPANEGLQSVMRTLHPQRLFPDSVELALHGHVHLFEAIGFASDHPTTLVLGNSGSAAEGDLPARLPAGTSPAQGARIGGFATHPGFGFAVLERVDRAWYMTEYDVDGQPLLRCALARTRFQCAPTVGR